MSSPASLFARVLGGAFAQLSPALQRCHQPGERLVLRGQASVQRGSGWRARLVCWCMGFPAAGDAVPVQVGMEAQQQGERWQRTFGTQSFASHLLQDRGAPPGMLVERFGPLRVQIALAVVNGALHWAVCGGALWRLPLPAWCLPTGDSREFESEGRFHFDVEITHPLTGRIVHYRGWLAPSEP